ncbi:unnamed protein product [Malus baccata var. baccata]
MRSKESIKAAAQQPHLRAHKASTSARTLLSSIPRFFIHPPESLPDPRHHTKPDTPIPTIDLADLHTDRRSSVIINHGIPSVTLDYTIAAVRAFHEQPTEVKARFYRREMGTGVSYISNRRPGIEPEEVEGDDVSGREGDGGPLLPVLPMTVGLTSHSDPGVLAVVLQDRMGGMQVKYGDGWVDVKPIVSNGEYRSVDHRVLANSSREPRVSIAMFFNVSRKDDSYGPLPELVSPEKPALYRQFTLSEFMQRFFNKRMMMASEHDPQIEPFD